MKVPKYIKVLLLVYIIFGFLMSIVALSIALFEHTEEEQFVPFDDVYRVEVDAPTIVYNRECNYLFWEGASSVDWN